VPPTISVAMKPGSMEGSDVLESLVVDAAASEDTMSNVRICVN
jgi:hypothetical protein